MARLSISIISIVLLISVNSFQSRCASLHPNPISFISKNRRHCSCVHTNAEVTQRKGDSTIVPRGGDATNTGKDDDVTTPNPNDDDFSKVEPFDTKSVSDRLKLEEIQKVKEAQQFLKKQQCRRDQDKTWLDKCITATIEFFENVFRWEVIDVKK